MKTRTETDSIGSLEVDEKAYYGVQTLRAHLNFPITGQKMSPSFLYHLALIKKAAAITNCEAGKLSESKRDAILEACDEVLAGKFQDQFIVDPIQGGAGTSANMNMNEVLANRANEILGGERGKYNFVHPNDDVNMSQSTNDVIPTAGKMTTLALLDPFEKELTRLIQALREKENEFSHVLKMGRTQLQDAVPMTMGETFSSYASSMERGLKRIETASLELTKINLGGTAIGTGINASSYYRSHIAKNLSSLYGKELTIADNLFDATENLDSFVEVSGSLKALAVSLDKLANDLRLLSSGPRTGLHELNLPPKQNGSSIMPGKVNPVIPEVVNQVCFLVIGHDQTITLAASEGQMELNAFEPVLFFQLFESITCLTHAIQTFVDNCITGITVNKKHCFELEQGSVGIVTALVPTLGYVKSAEIAKRALKENKTVKEILLAEHLMKESDMDKILNPEALAEEENK